MFRRFSRVFQTVWGTKEQQATVRETLAMYQQNPRFDWVLYQLDKERNRKGRSYVPIQFVDMVWNRIGFGSPATISLREDLQGLTLRFTLLHELGHVVGWNLLTPTDSSEIWAEDFKYWVLGGCLDGPVWDRLSQ